MLEQGEGQVQPPLCRDCTWRWSFYSSGVSLKDSLSSLSSQKEAQQLWISVLGAPSESGHSSQNTSYLPASWSPGESYFSQGGAEIPGAQETTHLELCFISDQASHDHEQL